jgi:hypothetical protein
MKMERKFSDFFRGKAETEFCKMETKTEYFVESETKREQRFLTKQMRKRLFLHCQYGPICDLVKLNRLSYPSPTPHYSEQS